MSNPFRRQGPPPVTFKTSSSDLPPVSIPHDNVPSPPPPINIQDSKKKVKSVKFQSPPPSSPLEDQTIPDKPPIPVPRFQFDEKFPELSDDALWESSLGVKSEEGRVGNAPVGEGVTTLVNPFEKTLATLERTDDDRGEGNSTAGSGKPMMDVEAFKRMLMTGETHGAKVMEVDTSIRTRKNVFGDDSETSFVSKYPDLESGDIRPLSSQHSHSSFDAESRFPDINKEGSSKTKPPAPAHKHGRPINLDLSASTNTSSEQSHMTSQSAASSRPPLARINTPPTPIDVHKPLPAQPSHLRNDSASVDPFSLSAIGRVPEPDSPVESHNPPYQVQPQTTIAPQPQKRGPPPPPTRRHSQLVADSKLSASTGRLSPSHEEWTTETRPASASSRSSLTSPSAPPPPPTRRPGSVRHLSPSPSLSPSYTSTPIITDVANTNNILKPPPSIYTSRPPPPPSRNSSTRTSRPPSIISNTSMDTSPTAVVSKHNNMSGTNTPPSLPPPRRERANSKNSISDFLSPSARSSFDGGGGGVFGRRSFDSVGSSSGGGSGGRRESGEPRRGSGGMGNGVQSVKEEEGEEGAVGSGSGSGTGMDVVGDIQRLQREIEEVMGRGGTRG